METKDNTKEEVKVKRQILSGKVVSDKMKDTVVVLVERYVKNQKYQKYMTISKRFKAHNPGNTKKVGDMVSIESCRPISKEKRFRVIDNHQETITKN